MIKVTSEADKVCVAKAHEAGQDHLFQGWDDLSPEAQRALIGQVQAIDFQLVKRLIRQHLHGKGQEGERRVLKPEEVEPLPASDAESPRYQECRQAGENAIAAGKVSLVTLAGGSGAGPLGEATGFLPVGPVTGKSLFQLQAERIRALNRRHRVSLRWWIVTHPESHKEIGAYFKQANFFGLSRSDVVFVPQPMLPLVDRRGKLILTGPGKLALSPNGHGGILLHFLEKENLQHLAAAGIEHLFFFQGDNPLVKIADPVFFGHHLLSGAEVSSKAIPRLEPDEELGIFCRLDGATGVIEHSQLYEEDRRRRLPDGTLALPAGNLAVHLFSLAFFERMLREKVQIPFHTVPCTLPCLNKRGQRVRPTEPNCIEFRCYLFDALWSAERSSIVEVRREDEFSPIKNTGGPCSPQSAQRDLSRLYARWLRNAGATFAGGANGGELSPAVEISPLYALDEDELAAKLELPMTISGDIVLGGKP